MLVTANKSIYRYLVIDPLNWLFHLEGSLQVVFLYSYCPNFT